MYSYKNLCRARPISSAAVGTFTNDSEGRANCLEMVTLLAGESGPDARAGKASAAPAKPDSGSGTKHPANRQPRRLSSRDEKCGPQYASDQCCNAVDGEDNGVECTQPPPASFFHFFFPRKNVVSGESFGGDLAWCSGC